MAPDPASPAILPPVPLPDWIAPGAVILDADGETSRILRITETMVHGVAASGSFWEWPRANLLAAIHHKRIQPAAQAQRQRATSGRTRPSRSAAGCARLAVLREHPLLQPLDGDLQDRVPRTLQALRRGDPAAPLDQVVLRVLAEVGAEADQLGRQVAAPVRKGGRAASTRQAAQAVQHLLARFRDWLAETGTFCVGDLQQVEDLVLRGLAVLQGDTGGPQRLVPADGAAPGRPPGPRAAAAQAVRFRLACRWRDHVRGHYKLADAIREVAEAEVLQFRQAHAAWQGQDPAGVTLGKADAEALQQGFLNIKQAYHLAYATPLSLEERRACRRYQASLLLLRRLRR